MKFRLLTLSLLTMLALGALRVAPAAAQPAPDLGAIMAPPSTQAFNPATDPILDLRDLEAFSYKLHRELTGAAAQRVLAVYQDGWSDFPGLVPAKLPANGKFIFDWGGDVVLPSDFQQTLIIGNNRWTEWTVNSKAKGRYNDNALINLNAPRNEVLFWWDNIADWLKTNGVAMDCGTRTSLINDEQTVRCNIASLAQKDKIALLDATGIFTDELTQSVSAMTFDLYVSKNDNIPVRFDLSATAVDAKNNTFSGRFTIDIFDIDGEDIDVFLPRS